MVYIYIIYIYIHNNNNNTYIFDCVYIYVCVIYILSMSRRSVQKKNLCVQVLSEQLQTELSHDLSGSWRLGGLIMG